MRSGIERQPKAIEIARRVEAAKLDRVEKGGSAVEIERDARRIAQRLDEVLGALVGDLILRHHRDRLRRCQDRRIGLGAGRTLTGEIADHRSIGAFTGPGASGGLHVLLPRGRGDPPRALCDRAALLEGCVGRAACGFGASIVTGGNA